VSFEVVVADRVILGYERAPWVPPSWRVEFDSSDCELTVQLGQRYLYAGGPKSGYPSMRRAIPGLWFDGTDLPE
jgi:hypothetical protein